MRVFVCVLIALLACVTLTRAETYVVDPYGTGDYPTIQAAVDACGSGDTVELTDGTFTGVGNRNISFNSRDLTLRSQSGDPRRTIIDCEMADRAFVIRPGEHEQFQGITVTRGRASDWGGAAILFMDGFARFLACIFNDNSAPGNAGAVMIMDCGYAEFEGCTFVSNSSYAGGAVCT